MSDSTKLRIDLAREGWSSQDKVTTQGWGDKVGFSIWFQRWDWRGRSCGSQITFHAHTSDLSAIDETIAVAAARAREAWERFPTEFPSQNADGTVVVDPALRGLWATARDRKRSVGTEV